MGTVGVDRIERVLGACAAGAAVRSLERFAPWSVARAHLTEGADGAPASVVVKWPRTNDLGWRTEGARTEREAVALDLLGDLVPGLAPRLLAFDDGGGVEAPLLVVEDLAPRVALWDLLRRGDAHADEGLLAFAGAMGALHAATAGAAEVFAARVSARGASVRLGEDRWHLVGDAWDWTLPDLPLGVRRAAATDADFARLVDTLQRPGPFEAFTNGDAGANNFLVAGGDGRIIDFEAAGFRHALVDAACLHVPGPMWMTVADPVPLGVEDRYRAAAAAGLPLVLDDAAYGLGLAAAALALALERLERFDRLDARPPGHESRRQIVSTLEAAARTAERWRSLPALASWTRFTADGLRRRWPDADVELPDAYTVRQPAA